MLNMQMKANTAAGLRQQAKSRVYKTAFQHAAQKPRLTCQPVKAAVAEAEAPAKTGSGVAHKDAIVLQAFAWDSCEKGSWYKYVESKVPEIKAAGITHAWLPPPSQSVAPQGYMPGQLYNLQSSYGNKEELKSVVKALKDADIKAIADIVINHRCADEQVDGVWNKFRDDVDHNGKKVDWGQWAITGDDPHFKGQGNPDTGDDYEPAPDLDHANKDLRAALKDWLKWLHDDIGFDSWRFDYVKGYGAEFIQEYVDASVGYPGTLNVGEYWTDLIWNGSDLDRNQDGPREKLVNWIKGTGERATAFDFPLKGILQEATKNTQYDRLKDAQGRASGLLGLWPGMTMTFVENHDTGSTQGHWPFPTDLVPAGYAYILTHPGVPSVFWDHLDIFGDECKNTIIELIKLRKRTGVNAESKLNILEAKPELYAASIDDKITMKLGPGEFSPGEGWSKVKEGKDFAVWEKK